MTPASVFCNESAKRRKKYAGEIYGSFLSDVNAAVEAERNTTRGPPTQNAAAETGSGERMFSRDVDKYFARQIDNWDGEDHGGSFRVGMPSKAMIAVGVPNVDIWFDQSKAASQLSSKEEITKGVIKQIPNVINNPTVISASYDNTVMLFGKLYDKDNNPIVVAIRINSVNRRNHISVINKVRSVGTRTHNLNTLLSDNAILYLSTSKKETKNWFNALGRSTPFGGTRFGLIKTIAQYNEEVNNKKATKAPKVPQTAEDVKQEFSRESDAEYSRETDGTGRELTNLRLLEKADKKEARSSPMQTAPVQRPKTPPRKPL